MIGAHDSLTLPARVVRRGEGLYDGVRGVTLPLNATGRVVLGAHTPAEAASALRERFAIDERRALADVVNFCAELNARLLLNVAPRAGATAFVVRWFVHLPFLVPLGALPRVPSVRRGVDTRTSWRTFVTGLRATSPFALLAFACAAAATLVMLAALGSLSASTAATVGAAVGAGVAVHELGHLLVLREVPACVVTRGLRIAVVHRSVSYRRQAAVAGAGPAAGVALAAILLAWPGDSGSLAALVLSLQAIGLTVVTKDGRTLCGLF